MADRLEDELVRAGLVPVGIVRPPMTDDELAQAPSLDVLRAQSGSRAGFEVAANAPKIWLVVSDPTGGPSVQRTIAWDADDPSSAAQVGVQAVEELRVVLVQTSVMNTKKASRLSLLELAQQGSEGPRVAVGVGPVLALGTVRAAPLAGIQVVGRVPLVGVLRAVTGLRLGLGSSSWDSAAGAIHLGESAFDLGVGAVLRDPDSPWIPDVGVTLSLFMGRLGYDAAPLYLPGDGLGYVRPGGTLHGGLTGPQLWRLAPRAEVAWAVRPPVEVRLDGGEVGKWGPSTVTFAVLADVIF